MAAPTNAAPRKSLEPFLKDSVEYYPHQVDGVRWLARKKSFLLGDDMGLGKSLQALTVFCIDVKLGRAETCIIVCPVTLRENWADEIEKFTRVPYTLLGEEPHPTRRGETKKLSPAKRQHQLVAWLAESGPRILICNYEQIAAAAHRDTLKRVSFDVAIFDEAQYIKNPQAARSKASLSLRAGRNFMLTGTPLLNQVNELWPILHKIEPAKYPKYWAFVNRYCVFGGYEGRQIIGTKNEKELKVALAEVQLRRKKRDVLSLKEPTYVPVVVGLTPEQQKLYDEVADQLVLHSPDGNMPTEEIENALTKFLRLKQICGTPYAIDPAFPDSSLKLDRVIEIVQEQFDNGEKIVLFTQFRGVLEAIGNRLARARVTPAFQLHGDVPTNERQALVKMWGSVRGPSIISCMTQVAGVGLNMTAGRVGIFVDKLFVPGLNQQAVDRLDRIGQEEPVIIFEMLARNTVEHRVETILKEKKKIFGDIVEGSVGMRNLIEALRKQLQNDLS